MIEESRRLLLVFLFIRELVGQILLFLPESLSDHSLSLIIAHSPLETLIQQLIVIVMILALVHVVLLLNEHLFILFLLMILRVKLRDIFFLNGGLFLKLSFVTRGMIGMRLDFGFIDNKVIKGISLLLDTTIVLLVSIRPSDRLEKLISGGILVGLGASLSSDSMLTRTLSSRDSLSVVI